MLENLKELVQLLDKIYPTQQTINPFQRIELRNYPTEYQYYLKFLTHYFTLIYKNHRAMDKAKYISSREDVTASLQLLEIMTLKRHRKETQIAEELYRILKKNTKENQILTARNISEIIGYSKTQTSRFILILLKMNQLKKIESSKNKGYLYQLETICN